MTLRRDDPWQIRLTQFHGATVANLVGALAAQPGMKQQTYLAGTSSVRRLTPLECERLQGFPDGWTATPGNSDTQRYRQLGNAVAVPVAEWVIQRIGAGT